MPRCQRERRRWHPGTLGANEVLRHLLAVKRKSGLFFRSTSLRDFFFVTLEKTVLFKPEFRIRHHQRALDLTGCCSRPNPSTRAKPRRQPSRAGPRCRRQFATAVCSKPGNCRLSEDTSRFLASEYWSRAQTANLRTGARR